jgi:hypothetical protein
MYFDKNYILLGFELNGKLACLKYKSEMIVSYHPAIWLQMPESNRHHIAL